MKLKSLDEAIGWATKFAQVFGDGIEIDIRPVTEAWDIGLGEKPAGLTTTRYMATQKHRGVDGCVALTPAQQAKMGELMAQMHSAGVLLSAVGLEASGRGACLKMSNGKPVVMDGPFAEIKELLGGFVIIREDSLQRAGRLGRSAISPWSVPSRWRFVRSSSSHDARTRPAAPSMQSGRMEAPRLIAGLTRIVRDVGRRWRSSRRTRSFVALEQWPRVGRPGEARCVARWLQPAIARSICFAATA